ncbi:hypothetical protein [Nocardioides ultimimeridianus]
MSTTPVVTTEDDATPLVRSLARTLRMSLAVPELRDLAERSNGLLALASVVDAQAATLSFEEGAIHVAHGVPAGVEPVGLRFDPEYTLEDTTDPLAEAAARLLSPPLPGWREAAARFWAVNHESRGFPSRLVIVCSDEGAELRFGDREETFEIHGGSDALAAVLSGHGDNFLYAVALGFVSIVGRSAQMSAICGAHWKVRFDD